MLKIKSSYFHILIDKITSRIFLYVMFGHCASRQKLCEKMTNWQPLTDLSTPIHSPPYTCWKLPHFLGSRKQSEIILISWFHQKFGCCSVRSFIIISNLKQRNKVLFLQFFSCLLIPLVKNYLLYSRNKFSNSKFRRFLSLLKSVYKFELIQFLFSHYIPISITFHKLLLFVCAIFCSKKYISILKFNLKSCKFFILKICKRA